VGEDDARRRRAWAEVDLAAIRHNAGVLARLSAPAQLCAVVKADGYGHGAPAVAAAALEGGASWLAVAVAEEGTALRAAGIDAPVLVLAEPPADAMGEVAAAGLTPTLYSAEGVAAAAAAAHGAVAPIDVHLKVDTGMHRVGAPAGELVALARAVHDAPGLRLAALWSHLAVAEGEEVDDRMFTAEQVRRFDESCAAVESAGIGVPMRHLANSAGAMAHPGARHDLVRCGIALYGEAPSAWAADRAAATGASPLRPALSWRARVSYVRRLPAGARPSYGRRRALPTDATVATVPVGYADGVPRRYFENGGTVLVGGRPCPLAGVVTMDQIVVDCGPGTEVSVGDEVVLIGRQGDAHRSATDWAQTLGTISYEVLCGIGPRIPRLVVDAEEEGSR
jgi:alanine racemase